SGSDFPIALHGNLAITTTGSGSANILLNDINATSGTTDSITLGGGTSGNTVTILGDKTTATLGSLTVTSAATGNHTLNLQTQQVTLDFAGSALLTLNAGTNTVNVGSVANKGIVQTTGTFGVGGANSTVTTTAVNSTFGGLNFNFSGRSRP